MRVAVGAFVDQVGGSPACRRELQLATDEAAAVLIDDAMPWTEIRLVVTYDDEDVYVRVVSRRAQPGRGLGTGDLTALLLDGMVESYELFADGQRGYAILQTSWDGVGAAP